jgi:hypothetical protein
MLKFISMISVAVTASACSSKNTNNKTIQNSTLEKSESSEKNSIAFFRNQCKPGKSEKTMRLAVTTQPKLVWELKDNKFQNNNVLPDSVIRGFRSDKGVCLLVPHFELGMLCGSSIDALPKVSTPSYKSPLNEAWPAYDYRNWLSAPYITDNNNLFALAHSEWYQCLQFAGDPAKKCSLGTNQFNSWSNAISSFRSNDGGQSWARIATLQRPASLSNAFPSLWSQKLLNHGFFHPSNIVFDNGFFYAFATHVARNPDDGAVIKSGSVLLRTKDLSAQTWEQVTADGKTLVDRHTGHVLNGTTSWDHLTITFNTSLCMYLVTFWDYSTQKVRYTTLDSLQKPVFGPVQNLENQDRVIVQGNDQGSGFMVQNYPTSQLDPDSAGKNFEFTDDSYFMYFGSFTGADVHARNMLRVRIDLVSSDALPVLSQAASGVIGNVDGVFSENNKNWLRGWACDKTVASSLVVHLYADGPAGMGQFIGEFNADQPSEEGISRACNTSGIKHRFSIDLSALNANQSAGRKLYVHGISKSDGINHALGNSGNFQINSIKNVSADIVSPPAVAEKIDEKNVQPAATERIPIFRLRKNADYLFSKDSSDSSALTYTNEGEAFRLNSTDADGHVPLLKCFISNSSTHFLSRQTNCEGHQNTGALGFMSPSQREGSVPLFRCRLIAELKFLATTNLSECSASLYTNEGIIGWVYLKL